MLPGALAPAAKAATASDAFRLTEEGVSVDAGSMGRFVLRYPEPAPESGAPQPPIRRAVSGNTATLSYDGGGTMTVTLGPGGTVAVTGQSMPPAIETVRMTMRIDFAFGQGGTWKAADGAAKPFPAEQPASPNLYQGEPGRFTLTGADGRNLTIETPQAAFVQLQDNRAWQWRIFEWWTRVPYQPRTPFQVRLSLGGRAVPVVRVDAFGQSASGTYRGKVAKEQELGRDAASEKSWNATFHPPRRDAYGGLPGSGASLGLRRTGFFHVETHGEKSLLVDPDGNAFFQLGVCSFSPGDDYTYVAGREREYAWLPPSRSAYRTAYRPGDTTAFSFHLANRIRKTGKPYDLDAYLADMIVRVRAWGFNSCGAFSPVFREPQKKARWPYVAHLRMSHWEGFAELPGVASAWDPFDDKNRAQVEKQLAQAVAPHAADPLLIGYFVANEPLYENLPRVLPALNGGYACKRRFVRALLEKYGTIDRFNGAWSTNVRSFDALADQPLSAGTDAARADVRAFVETFLDEWFELVATTFRRYDKNHLLLGSRLQPKTADDETLCRVSGRWMDVVSINYYAYGIDASLLGRIHRWSGKPLLLSEFTFSSPSDSKLPAGGREVSSQADRGLAYRDYVEHAAALGYVVGIEWFTLVDQALTGRYFEKYNGEAANTGLIGVSDRPWKPMIEHMAVTNAVIYDVLLGKRTPFVWNDPRTRSGAGK